MSLLHEETYRGVTFTITNSILYGPVGAITNRGAGISGAYFCRFLTKEERENITVENMRRGIDRLIANQVVYSGDLRDMP